MTKGNYLGTLAVTRSCGRKKQKTVLADSQTGTLTHSSRFLSKSLKSPQVEDFENFKNWLIQFGKKHRGISLYPSGDDMALLVALYREELRHYFRLYSPNSEVIFSLLNKFKLYRLAQQLGIPIPETAFPTSLEQLKAVSETIEYPVLIKLRTHVGTFRQEKGIVCENQPVLQRKFAGISKKLRYHPILESSDRDISWPLVQSFVPSAMQETYSVSGFVDRSQTVFLIRAANKVFQLPIRVGVGLCFESRR